MDKVEVPGVPVEFRDEAALYRLSGLVDTLRDTAKDLLAVDVSIETSHRMGKRYGQIRRDLSAALTDATVESVNTWLPTLDSATPGMDEIFDAASTLARLLDNVLGLGQFLVGRKLQRAEWRQVLATLGDEDTEDRPAESAGGNGQYL